MIMPFGKQFFLVPDKTSEQEIEEKILKQRKTFGVVISSLIVVIGFTAWYLFIQDITDLYTAVIQPLPPIAALSPLTILTAGVATFFLLDSIFSKLPKYKTANTNEKKIKVTVMPDSKTTLQILLILALAIGVITYSFVQPLLALASM